MNRIVLSCFVILMLTAGCRAGPGDGPDTGVIDAGEGDIKMESSYTTYFADCRRSSFQEVPASCAGEILWTRDLRANGDLPRGMFLFGGNVVLEYPERFSLYSSGGDHLWDREKFTLSPIGITGSSICFRDEHHRLSSVNPSGDPVLKNVYLPGAIDEDFRILLLWTGRSDFLYVIQFDGGPEELAKSAQVHRTTYRDRLAKWSWTTEATQILPPLYIPEMERVVLFADMIYFIDAISGEEIARRQFPLEERSLASAGPDGTVYLSGRDKSGPAISAFGPQGDELWRWHGDAGTESLSDYQPPLIGGDGTVYIIAGPKISAIKAGEERWAFEVEGATFSAGTVFGDGSVAAAAGERLVGLDKEGRNTYDIGFEGSIVLPPVGAGDGSLFLLTDRALLRIR
ncbi:MAG: PQQ-like beta-propeller repeat protein [bacterium]|nr:PQQ-like beta-propeller repeat protein [bacterium]